MNVEIGNEAVKFHIRKYMFQIFGTVYIAVSYITDEYMLVPGAQAAKRRRL